MITLVKTGFYKLIETKHNVKILSLDKKTYAWVEPGIGEILVFSRTPHRSDCVLALGQYRIYEVVDEATLTDLLHLELEVGRTGWQGYLLTTGLPTQVHKRTRIIPTHEIITGNPRYKNREMMQKTAAHN